MSSTSSTMSLSVSWKGTFNGAMGESTYAGKAAFSRSAVSGKSSTGSFPGTVQLTLPFPSSSQAQCATTKGIKKLTVSGAISFGATILASSDAELLRDIEPRLR